ncbi:MAG: TIGR03936 family radical SAM-associated protein [Clostridium sp.]|uniref:TIGR03936 family radical SAM-associated protein n=1 Tax=Clostridium sp. TaxID=1506 RepID=UPI003026E1D0
MRYVIKFTKGEGIRFISHLDLMRTIQRVIRRSGIDIDYSKGFNPHMALALAQPLSVGVYSDGDYLDIVLRHEMDPTELVEALNNSAPPTIRFSWAKGFEQILNIKRLPQSMALIDASRFIIKFELDSEKGVTEKVEALLAQEEWNTIKKSKKGEKEANIKPLVHEYKYWVKDGYLIVNALIASGSREHLSPDLVARYTKEFVDNINAEAFVDIKREEMYLLKDDQFMPLCKAL